MFSDAAKNLMLQALIDVADAVSLHDGDPGAAGANNEVTGGGYTRATIAEVDWTGPSSGAADLTAPESFSGPSEQAVTHFGLWDGATFLGAEVVTGDGAFNAAGEYTLDVTVQITDT